MDIGTSDFEDYREKVNEYIAAHRNEPAINKLLYNEPISADDYKELERIFTEELGTVEDYEMNYQDTPFGLLIRKIAKWTEMQHMQHLQLLLQKSVQMRNRFILLNRLWIMWLRMDM